MHPELAVNCIHPLVATTYNIRGLLYIEIRCYNEAEEFYFNSLQIQERVLPKTHTDLADIFSNIGSFIFSNTRLSECGLVFYDTI
jgi:hypothetical protein